MGFTWVRQVVSVNWIAEHILAICGERQPRIMALCWTFKSMLRQISTPVVFGCLMYFSAVAKN